MANANALPVDWWVPIATAFVAAATASFGFFLSNRAGLIEQRRNTYAAALLAVRTYQLLPFRIRRRAAADAETRNALGGVISDAERDIEYYSEFLDLGDKRVAARYRALAWAARNKSTPQRAEAWMMAPRGPTKT